MPKDGGYAVDKQYTFRVWVGKGKNQRLVFIKAYTAVEAKIIARQQYKDYVAAVWRVEVV
jgi:hypothetical protein